MLRYLRTISSDLFSFEAVFVLFLLAGTFKSNPLFALIPYDVTALLMVGSIACALKVVLTSSRGMQAFAWPYVWLCVCYFLYAAVSYVLGSVYGDAANRKAFELLMIVTWAVAAPLFIMNQEGRPARFLRFLTGFAVVMSIDSLIRGNSMGSVGFIGTFGGVTSYQGLGRIAFVGLTVVAIHAIRHPGAGRRAIMAALAAALALAAVLSAARQVVAGAGIVALYLTCTLGRETSKIRTIPSLVFVSGLVALSVFVLISQFFTSLDMTHAFNRLSSIVGSTHSEALANSGRLVIWREGLQVWAAHPVFGAGFGSFSEISNYTGFTPHNILVEHLSELGLLGLVLAIALLVWCPLRAIALNIKTWESETLVTLGAVWMFLLTCAMFSGDVTDNRLLFSLSALIVAEASEIRRRRLAKGLGAVPSPGRLLPSIPGDPSAPRRELARLRGRSANRSLSDQWTYPHVYRPDAERR